MRIKYRPHLTEVCGLARLAHNLSDGLEATQGVRRKGQTAITDAIPTWQAAQDIYQHMRARGKIKPTKWYTNQEQRYYAEAVGVHGKGCQLKEQYEQWSDVHTIHLATRQGYGGAMLEGLLSQGHTPKLGYFAPGSVANLKDVACEDLLGWVMYVAERMHFLSRIPTDEEGHRCPAGNQQAAWQAFLEADLHYHSLEVPAVVPGLDKEEREVLQKGLKRIRDIDQEKLNCMRALIRKAYTVTDKTLQHEEMDALTTWVDRILDPSKGYSEAHT